MIPTKFHTFVDGRTDAGRITAERLNKNWDNLYDMFDPAKVGISEDNIASNAKILIANRNYTGANKITGSFEFSSFPIVPDGSIPDSKLSNKVLITDRNYTGNNKITGSFEFASFPIVPDGSIPDSKLSNKVLITDRNYTGTNKITGSFEFASFPIVPDGSIPDSKLSNKVLIANRNYTGDNKITGSFEFASFPIVPDGSIPDSKLSNNIPRKNTANTFSALQTFTAGLDLNKSEAKNIVIHKVSTLPSGTSADIGRIVYCTSDNKFYGWNGITWKQLDYTGDYTGGAVRTYSAELIVESNKEARLYFKTEGSSPTVKLTIRAYEFPSTFYTELPYHRHSVNLGSHSHEISQTAHTHSITLGSHTHSGTFATYDHVHLISGYTGAMGGHEHTATQDSHSHSFYLTTSSESANHTHGMQQHTHVYYLATEGIPVLEETSPPSNNETTGQSNDHTHTVSGDTSSVQPSITISSVSDHSHSIYFNSGASSANSSVGSTDLGTKTSSGANASITILGTSLSGNTEYAGVNTGLSLATVRKQFADGLRVIIDTTDITNNILATKGWQAIGNNTGTHPIHTEGTGEIDISSWVSLTPGLHILRITEPVSERGCSILVHLETS